MKFTITQSGLLEGLQKVSGVIPSKSTTPVLENVLFDLEESGLNLTGTDLEVSITTKVFPQTIEETGSIALPARVMTEMMRSLPDVMIRFESEENNRIKITTDRGLYRVTGISKENYPEIPRPSEDKIIEVKNDRLRRMFSKTLFAVSSDELRPALMGVYVQIMGDEMRMVATDGHRLSKIVDKSFRCDESMIRMIVPPKAVQIALRNLDEGDTTKLVADERCLSFFFQNTTLFTRLVDGQYPDYEKVIPRDNDKTLTVDKNLLISSLKRVSLFSSVLTHQVRFDIQSGKMAVLSEDVDSGGQAKEEIDVEFVHDSMEICYNAQYVTDILKQIDTEQVTFLLKTPVNAALISPTKQEPEETFQMLIMPIKLSS
jgi:DNA polymerase-3 subunit beta